MTSEAGSVRPTGLTKDAGWEVGIRRTFPVEAGPLWEHLTSPAGLAVWLGAGASLPGQAGERFQGTDGTTGDLRSREDGRLLRLTWQPSGWPEPSTLQLRLGPATSGTTISVHHERLDSEDRREAMRTHWAEVIDRLVDPLLPADR